MVQWRRVTLLALATALILGLRASPGAAADKGGKGFIEHFPGKDYYLILDEKGRTLSMMGLAVSVGDYLITEDNRGYNIVAVDGFRARARFDKTVNLGLAANVGRGLAAAGGGAMGPIATWCTHSGESYKPTSGTDNKTWGDIFQVQAAFASALRKKGFSVIESKKNFNPHDADAYMRSRRTAVSLLARRPVLMVDIHRDGIPSAGYYARQVSGKNIAALRLVVGKQNANRGVNFELAKQLKAAADKTHPGLVREIFWAQGNYNQDLAPRTILMEFGTFTNSLPQAQNGATLMADAVSLVLTGTQGNRGAGVGFGRAVGSAAGRTALWIVGLAVLGGIGFVFLNAGSWDRVKQRFGKFFKQEVGLGSKDDRDKLE